MAGVSQLLILAAAATTAPSDAAGAIKSVSQILGCTYSIVGLVAFFLFMPHARGKVPPGRWYGVRLPQALQSDKAWYDINRFAGRCFMAWALVLIVSGVTVLLFPISKPNAIVPYMMIMSVLTVVPIVSTWYYAKKF